MTYTLGIDIGTFSSKGVIVDDEGRIVATADTPHKMLVPQPGWAEHRPREDWWDDFTKLSRQLIAESGVPASEIKAVACSAIGPCMLPVDRDGEPLMNGVLYGVDTRAAVEIDELNAAIGEDVILDRCGNALTSQSVGPKILWLKKNHPDLFARTHKILTASSFLVHRLTGEFVIDHYTAANSSPFYLVDKLDWSTELAEGIVDLDLMPRLLWSTEIAGHVSAKAAEETGLAEGTPVTAGTVDAAAEALSVGVLDPGDMMAMYGSTIFIIELTESRVRDPRLWYAPWLFEGQHASMSGLSTSGTLTHWFRERFARELDPETGLITLAEEAAQSPRGARGLVFLPYFAGERTPIHDPFAKGVLFGLTLSHSREDVYRSILEGIAYGTAQVFDTYAAVGQPPERILAVGGGTKNPVWIQATSDISGRPQILCEQTIGASYGDAFLAAMAIGKAQREDIRQWNPVASRVEAEAAEAYERQYEVFKQIYERTADLMHKLG